MLQLSPAQGWQGWAANNRFGLELHGFPPVLYSLLLLSRRLPPASPPLLFCFCLGSRFIVEADLRGKGGRANLTCQGGHTPLSMSVSPPGQHRNEPRGPWWGAVDEAWDPPGPARGREPAGGPRMRHSLGAPFREKAFEIRSSLGLLPPSKGPWASRSQCLSPRVSNRRLCPAERSSD